MSTAQGPFPMETTYTWHDAGDRATRMTLRNRGGPAGFAKVAAPVMARAMRRAMTADLQRLSEILQTRASLLAPMSASEAKRAWRKRRLSRHVARRWFGPRFGPRELSVIVLRTPKAPPERGFRLIGETDLTATARPPAGRFWLYRGRFSRPERT